MFAWLEIYFLITKNIFRFIKPQDCLAVFLMVVKFVC